MHESIQTTEVFPLKRVLPALLVLSLLLSGCGSTPSAPFASMRPADAPDVAILGFAGRCGAGCGAPSANKAYLHREDATLQEVASAFVDTGSSVAAWSYAATVAQIWNDYGDAGYVEAQALLGWIEENWIAEYANPTRVVLVAHSHGTLWASLLAMENPEVPIDYFVYLDGVCNSWEADNLKHGTRGNIIWTHFNNIGWGYPKTLEIYGGACNAYPVIGAGLQHLKDVVPANVRVGLEVQSNPHIPIVPDSVAPVRATAEICGLTGWFGVADATVNRRADGSAENLFLYESSDQDHCEVALGSGAAVQAVAEFIRRAERGITVYGGSGAGWVAVEEN